MTKKKNDIVVDPVEVELKTRMDNLVDEIKEIEVKLAETDALFESKVSYIREQRDDRVTILNTAKLHKETQLLALFEQVPQAETKTQRKVALLSGDVVVKKSVKKLDYDSKKLLGYFQDTVCRLTAEEEELTNKINELHVEIGMLNEMPWDENTDRLLSATINKRDSLEESIETVREQLAVYGQYIECKSVEALKWSEFKAVLSITDSGIVNTETGDVIEIDGLNIVEEPEKLVIK